VYKVDVPCAVHTTIAWVPQGLGGRAKLGPSDGVSRRVREGHWLFRLRMGGSGPAPAETRSDGGTDGGDSVSRDASAEPAAEIRLRITHRKCRRRESTGSLVRGCLSSRSRAATEPCGARRIARDPLGRMAAHRRRRACGAQAHSRLEIAAARRLRRQLAGMGRAHLAWRSSVGQLEWGSTGPLWWRLVQAESKR